MSTIARTLDEALAPITDGCMLAVPRESSGAAMAATRALVRRGVKRLDRRIWRREGLKVPQQTAQARQALADRRIVHSAVF